MILADVCVRRPVFATMLIGVLVVAGWFSYKSLTLELLAKDQHSVSTVVVLPLKIKGGEASLVRPIAIA